jgi:hypothetical protein
MCEPVDIPEDVLLILVVEEHDLVEERTGEGTRYRATN